MGVLDDLKTFEKIYPIFIQKYESYIPSEENSGVTEKINSMIQYLSQIGRLNNDVVNNWNKVMKWLLEEGLSETIEKMVIDGRFDILLETLVAEKVEVLEAVLNAQIIVVNNKLVEMGEATETTNDMSAYAKEQADYLASKYELIEYFTGEQTNLQTQLNNLVLSDGTSDAETIQARGGEDLLYKRLDKTDSKVSETSIHLSAFPIIVPEADDSGRLQRAIDSLPNGGNILIAGQYTIGGVIINAENINIFGRSKHDQFIVKNGTTGILVKQNKVSFEKLTVISQGTKTDGLNTNGILYEKTPANSIGFATVKNVDFKLFSGFGLKVVNAIKFTYDFGYVIGCTKGIVFDRDAGGISFGTTVVVRLVYLSNCTRGIDAYRLHRTLFEEVVAEYCDYGIYADICSFTLLRGYFEKNYIKGVYAVDCEFQDLYNYENNTTTDAIQVAFTSAVLANDRGYVRGNKFAFTSKTIGILSNYGVDPKYFSAYGNTNNIGLKYAENIVPLVRGDNLAIPSAWASNRISEFQGFDQAKQGYKIQGITAGDNSYGIKQDVTLDNTKQYIIDIVNTTVSGSGITTIRCGTLTVTNGVPFTPPVNGLQTIKAFGIDVAGTPFECYINAFSLSEVKTQEKYTAIAQDKLSRRNQGRGVLYSNGKPTTGTHAVGEKYEELTPIAGGYAYYVCVTAGTPGVWKGFGLIEV